MASDEINSISRETAEHYTWGGQCDGWHLLRAPELSVIQERMPPGTSEVRHSHHRAQQFFYILSGEALMEVDGRSMTLAPGQGIWIPAGTPHQMKNDSSADVHFLVISQPPSHGDRELAPLAGFRFHFAGKAPALPDASFLRRRPGRAARHGVHLCRSCRHGAGSRRTRACTVPSAAHAGDRR